MNPFSSLKQLKRVNREDKTLSRLGLPRGWLLYQHYRGRLRSRFGYHSKELTSHLQVAGKRLAMHIMPEQLSSLFGIYGDDEYDLRDRFTSPPQTILDLGANSGMATLYFHAHYPEAAIACVEPDPRNQVLLEKTLKSNHLDKRFSVIPAAIAAKPGQLKLRMGLHSTCSALETSPMHELADSTLVEVTTVPVVLQKLGWQHIDLLKIDIEGTEDELLSQENAWLEKVGSIVLEIHPNTTPEKIASYLAPFGFKLSALNRGIEPVFFASRG